MNWKNTAKTIDRVRRLEKFNPLGVVVVVSALAAMLVGWGGSGVMGTAAAEAMADEPENSEDESYRVDAIVVQGLLRTHRDVIERELLFEEGDVVTTEEVEESIQRLRNTEIFRQVDYRFADRQIGAHRALGGVEEARAEEARLLEIRVEERWTLTAFFQFGQGGDTFQIMVGAMDVNWRGQNQHLGGTYSRLGDANSFALWFRDPGLFDGDYKLALRTELNNRIYTFYDADGDIEGGFMRRRRFASFRLDRQWQRRLTAGLRSSVAADEFSYDMVGDQRRRAQQRRGGLTGPMQTLRFGVATEVGRLDDDEFQVAGTRLDAEFDQGIHFGDAERLSRQFRATLHHFVDLPRRGTLAMRGQIGFRSTDVDHLQFFAGGLDTVRGTFDMRHRGKHHWLGNAEVRIPSIKHDRLVIQNTAFVDGVGVTEIPSQVLDLTAATTGVGLRVIFRDMHAMIVRLDYALPVWGADGPALSFGAGQFF